MNTTTITSTNSPSTPSAASAASTSSPPSFPFLHKSHQYHFTPNAAPRLKRRFRNSKHKGECPGAFGTGPAQRAKRVLEEGED